MRLTTLLLLVACSGDDADDIAFCDDAPVVTYANFGDGFMTENCQTCHASETPDRNGAPESVIFDTLDDILDQSDRILDRAAAEEATMPPAGGVSEDDRYLLDVWLTCWE
ncbi:MAG: putative membrane protein [Myxococcota bacterium]|jgi:uncharacterized membrane protein